MIYNKEENFIKSIDEITSILIFEGSEEYTDIRLINTNQEQNYIEKNIKHTELINIIEKKDNFYKIVDKSVKNIFYINVNFVDKFIERKGFPQGSLYEIKLTDGTIGASLREEEYNEYNKYITKNIIKNKLANF